MKLSHVSVENALDSVTSGSRPPAVFSVPPASILALAGRLFCLASFHCEPVNGLFSGFAVRASLLRSSRCRVSSAIFGWDWTSEMSQQWSMMLALGKV